MAYAAATMAKVLELSQRRPPLSGRQIADRLGMARSSVYPIRLELRKAGHKLTTQPRGRRPLSEPERDGLDDDSGARCRCGVRLGFRTPRQLMYFEPEEPHACLPTTAAAYAQQVRTHYSDLMGDRIASWRGGKRVYR